MKWFINGLSALAAVGLFLLMGTVFCDVIARNFLARPLQGAGEVARFMLGLSIFLALPVATIRQEHISVDLILAINSRVLRAVELGLAMVLSAAFFAILAWKLYDQSLRAASYNDVTLILGIPVAPFAMIMAVLSGVSALVVFVRRTPTPESETDDGIGSNQL